MSELGQWLREARQAQNLTLEQVEAETRIRAKFLTALEEGSLEALPDHVSAKGFLRNYARFLGLDPDEALSKYSERKESGRNTESSLFRPLEVTLFQTATGALRWRLFLLVLIFGVIAAGLWAWKNGRLAWPPPLNLFKPTAAPSATLPPTNTPTRPARPSITATEAVTITTALTGTPRPSPTSQPSATDSVLVRPTATSSPTFTVTPTPTPENGTSLPSPTTSPTTALEANVTVSILVNEESWIEVTVDSRNVLRALWQPGDEGDWQAEREIILRLGNAGGVDVTLNGETLEPLGERQQVVEFAWGPEGEITPEPTFTPTPTPRESPEAQETPIS